MRKNKPTVRRGFTIVELAITVVVSVIVILGIGVVLADSQRNWNRMYNRIYSDVVTDSYVARKMFDSVIRKASREKLLVDDAGNWLEVYYYADSDSEDVDRYARFYKTGSQLSAEYGKLDPLETLTTTIVCENVSNCVFKQVGRSAQMILTLDNGTQAVTTTSSAVMHNQ